MAATSSPQHAHPSEKAAAAVRKFFDAKILAFAHDLWIIILCCKTPAAVLFDMVKKGRPAVYRGARVGLVSAGEKGDTKKLRRLVA